jgi:DUF4097 and DUF4098 domain-containing protein YvlB
MKRTYELQARSAFVLTFCAMLMASLANASDRGEFSEEFHQTYAISPDGRVELENINGAVHVTVWDRSEVKVDAVKYAHSRLRLDEVRIEVRSEKDFVSIETKYPGHDHTFNSGSNDNPATVEYTLTVPRTIRLHEIRLINGSFDVTGVVGEVHASCINGKLEAKNLSGRAELSTVNGKLEATFDSLPRESSELRSVNGTVELTIPSDSNAEIEASTVSGGIENDFGLHVDNHRLIGHELRGELGSGGTHIKLEDVNGRIDIRHADDGRTMSPAKDLSHRDHDSDDDDND